MTRQVLGRPPAVVALGGGHGLAASLQALRRVTSDITAIVTVADDGGSSGRLRRQFDMLPPGDLRMALAALCGDDADGRLWADVLQSRFGGDGPLAGHAIGNLLIAGVWEKLGDPVAGLDLVGRLLNVQGRVLPMSAVPLVIHAEVLGAEVTLPDEVSVVTGQVRVATSPGDILQVWLEPAGPPACPEAVRAVLEADHLVLGPGSWYSSVIPHLLVPELAEAIVGTRARRILTLNLDTADETRRMPASAHLEALAEHEPRLRLDAVVCDPSFVRDDPHLASYARSLGAELVVEQVRMSDGSARHDPNRLASVYADLMAG